MLRSHPANSEASPSHHGSRTIQAHIASGTTLTFPSPNTHFSESSHIIWLISYCNSKLPTKYRRVCSSNNCTIYSIKTVLKPRKPCCISPHCKWFRAPKKIEALQYTCNYNNPEFLDGTSLSPASNTRQSSQSVILASPHQKFNLGTKNSPSKLQSDIARLFLGTRLFFWTSLETCRPHRQDAAPLFAAWFSRCVSVPYHSKNGQNHPKDYLKIQALLAKEKEPKGQNKYGLHVA